MPTASLELIQEKLEIITNSVLIAKTLNDVISRAKKVISICVDEKGFKSFGLESDYEFNKLETKKGNIYKIYEKVKKRISRCNK